MMGRLRLLDNVMPEEFHARGARAGSPDSPAEKPSDVAARCRLDLRAAEGRAGGVLPALLDFRADAPELTPERLVARNAPRPSPAGVSLPDLRIGGAENRDRGNLSLADGLSTVPGGHRASSLMPEWKPLDRGGVFAARAGIESAQSRRQMLVDSTPLDSAAVVERLRGDLSGLIKGQADSAVAAQFEQQMRAFEQRCINRGLPNREIAATYIEIKRVLESPEVARLCSPAKLAREILRNAAHPTLIDQGQHPTCNVTSYECYLYASAPSQAARLVASVAVTGEFRCADGTVIRPRSLTPDDESAPAEVHDGHRNFASQIFQNTTINIYWNRQDKLPDFSFAGRGNIQYCQNGEGGSDYLLDYSKSPPAVFSFKLFKNDYPDSPYIGLTEIAEIHKQVTGRDAKDLGIERHYFAGERNGIHYVGSFENFKTTLSDLYNKNGFPVLLVVDAAMKPFSDGSRAHERFSPHLVSITGFDPETGLVKVDNQWGSYNDFTGQEGQKPAVPVAELFASMRRDDPKGFKPFWDMMKENVQSTTLGEFGKISATSLANGLAFRGLTGDISYRVQLGLYRGTMRGSSWCSSALDYTYTARGGRVLRTGSALGSLRVALAVNDVPGAFSRSTEEGVGKLLRAGGQGVLYEIGHLTGHGLSGLARFKWAPGRFGVAVGIGLAAATLYDRSVGEVTEMGGRMITNLIVDRRRN